MKNATAKFSLFLVMLALTGCVVAPAPGYYAPRPYYPGPYVERPVVYGGGYYYHHGYGYYR